MTLLIIDDESHIRQMMRLTLETAGHQVDEAGSGEEGLAAFRAARGYDAVVLDQKMPGIDGLETLRRLKEGAPDVPVLMVTAFASIELAVDAMKLGATDFLRKPMTPEALRGAVAAAMATRATARRVERPVIGTTGRPLIETLTLNGFQIRRAPGSGDPNRADHLFLVKGFGDGTVFEVTVTIDPDIVARVARLSLRDLKPGGAFWREQAERWLSASLWSEGRIPEPPRLTVRDVTREDIDIAAAWPLD